MKIHYVLGTLLNDDWKHILVKFIAYSLREKKTQNNQPNKKPPH